MDNKHNYKVLLKLGEGSYCKDILKLSFSEDDVEFTLDELLSMVIKQKAEIEALKADLARAKADSKAYTDSCVDNQNHVNKLLAESVESLSKQILMIKEDLWK